jgi:hypothetical protein
MSFFSGSCIVQVLENNSFFLSGWDKKQSLQKTSWRFLPGNSGIKQGGMRHSGVALSTVNNKYCCDRNKHIV